MSWSNNMSEVQVGSDVYGSDGDKVGSVAEVQSTYLVVEKGFFFPTDYYIPVSAISQVQDGQVVLNVPKDTALHSGWDTIPDTSTSTTLTEVQSTYLVVEKGFFFPTDYYIPVSAISQVQDGQVVLNVPKDTALHSGWDTIPDTSTSTSTTLTDTSMSTMPATDLVSGTTVDAAAWQTDTTMGQAPVGGQHQVAGYEATSQDELVIPLREEELTATVRETEAGAARIQKTVVAEDRVLEVPVTEEQIRVERRVVDRAAGVNDADAFEEMVIDVPLTQQEVELRKQARVAEEVVVSKDAIQHTEQVRGTVRREEVDVVDESMLTETRVDQDRAI